MPTRFAQEEPKQAADPTHLLKVALRGIGQVMFQGHAVTGLLFFAGIAVASPLMAAGAAIGAALGPAVAHRLKYRQEDIEAGIFGFNSTLVGIALLFYLRPEFLTWALVVVGCALAAIVTHLMRRFLNFPTYTSPFVVCTWVLLLVAHGIAGTAIDLKPAPPQHTPHGFLEAVLAGAAEVMFGANILTGVLFLAGIALSNWRHAVVAAFGSVVGTALAYYHHNSQETIAIGIYGYNSLLAAMAVYLWRPSLNLSILAAIVATPLTEFFPKSLGIPPLTAPFVIAAWIVIAVGSIEPCFNNEIRLGRKTSADEHVSLLNL